MEPDAPVVAPRPLTTSLPGPSGRGEPLAVVQTEAVCEGCGYILRSQAVIRDAATGILVVRCPECSMVQPVVSLSTRRHRWALALVIVQRLCLVGIFAIVLLSSWGAALVFWPSQEGFLIPSPGLSQPGWKWIVDMVFPWLPAEAGVLLGSYIVIFRFGPIVRTVILMGLMLLLQVSALGITRDPFGTGSLLATMWWSVMIPPIIQQQLVALLIGLFGRWVLRGLLRALLPNAGRYVFEPLWSANKKLVTPGRW